MLEGLELEGVEESLELGVVEDDPPSLGVGVGVFEGVVVGGGVVDDCDWDPLSDDVGGASVEDESPPVPVGSPVSELWSLPSVPSPRI